MAFLTPGVIYLSNASVPWLICSVLIAAVRYALHVHFGTFISLRTFAMAATIGLPLLTLARYGLRRIQERRRATALGARLTPRLAGKLPGNLDSMVGLLQNFKSGYPGMLSWWTKLARISDYIPLSRRDSIALGGGAWPYIRHVLPRREHDIHDRSSASQGVSEQDKY